MSLKSLLQVLCGRFYSRQNGAEIAGLAAPSEKNTAISLGGGDSVVIVSPANGFLTVYSSGSGSGNSPRELKIYSEPENTGVSIGINLESTSGGYVFAPVRKGQTLRVWGAGLDLSRCSARVHEFVGGGAKTVLDWLGGGLCLKTASTTFCALRSRLPLRARTRSLKPSLQARKSSSRLSMAMPSLSPLMSTASTRSTSKTTACSLSYLRTCLRGLARGYLAGRDNPSGSRSTERPIRLCDSLPVSLSLDGLTGKEVCHGL